MKETTGLIVGLVLMLAGILGGCTTQPQVVVMQAPGGQQEQMTVPKSTWRGTASGAQADVLAQEIVMANNNAMKQFDHVDGRLDKMQATEKKELETSQQALARLEELAAQQGTGQITLFFKTGSAHLDKFQADRLIQFLDYLGRGSRGRKAILVSIGGASATGSHQVNKKLSIERSQAPLPIIEQYLVNVPHKFYKVTGVGDMYAPKDASMQVEQRYQNVRIIAAYDTANLPIAPGK